MLQQITLGRQCLGVDLALAGAWSCEKRRWDQEEVQKEASSYGHNTLTSFGLCSDLFRLSVSIFSTKPSWTPLHDLPTLDIPTLPTFFHSGIYLLINLLSHSAEMQQTLTKFTCLPLLHLLKTHRVSQTEDRASRGSDFSF